MECVRCGGVAELANTIMASGMIHTGYVCWACEKVADPKRPYMGKEAKKDIDTSKLPTFADYSHDRTCEICGKAGAEFHHWLPQALWKYVEDAHKWPYAYLCPGHHRAWHYVVTPYFYHPHWQEEKYEPIKLETVKTVGGIHQPEDTNQPANGQGRQ